MTNILYLLFCILVSIMGLGLLVFIHELGHFSAAKHSGVGVKDFSLGFGKKIFGFKRGETEYKIGFIPLGGYINLEGFYSEEPCDPAKSYDAKPKLTRLKIIAAGVIFNLIFATVLLTAVNMYGVKKIKPVINPQKGNPAAEALVAGDEITEVNGVKVEDWDALTAEIRKSGGETLTFTILRDGWEKRVQITPVKTEAEDEFGAKVQKWVIGITPTGKTFRAPGMPPDKAFIESLKTAGKAYSMTYLFIGKLFAKKAKAEKGVAGPIFIVYLMTFALRDGFFSFVQFLALISLALAVMNSLPIPVLDGGYMLFLAIEAVRGKPIGRQVMRSIQSFFFWLLMMLAFLAAYLDLLKILP